MTFTLKIILVSIYLLFSRFVEAMTGAQKSIVSISQELATMINKGKGKLKWERDMPRNIEEKLEVGNFFFSFFSYVRW